MNYGEYTIWSDQLSAFIKEVIVPECGCGTMTGNSRLHVAYRGGRQ